MTVFLGNMRKSDINLEDLKRLLENTEYSISEFPKEALKPGTLCRSTRLDKLGVIVDAFYGDTDADNKKIVVYTILLFPESRFGVFSYNSNLHNESLYVTNEYEYEIIAYLMIPRIDISHYSTILGGEVGEML